MFKKIHRQAHQHIKKIKRHAKNGLIDALSFRVYVPMFKIIFLGITLIITIFFVLLVAYGASHSEKYTSSIMASEADMYGNTIYVYPYISGCPDHNAPDCFYGARGIQAAIDYAQDGDQILIKSGIYGPLNLYIGGEGKDKFDITIRGEDQIETVLDGGCSQNGRKFRCYSNGNVITVLGNSTVNIESLTIQNARYNGIELRNFAQTNLKATIINNNLLHGIKVGDQAEINVNLSNINHNGYGPEKGAGIVLEDVAMGSISNSLISSNYMQGVAVTTKNYDRITNITRSEIIKNGQSGVALFNFANLNMQDSRVNRNNIDGLTLADDSKALIYNNEMNENKKYGLNILDRSSIIDSKENFAMNNKLSGKYCYNQGICRSLEASVREKIEQPTPSIQPQTTATPTQAPSTTPTPSASNQDNVDQVLFEKILPINIESSGRISKEIVRVYNSGKVLVDNGQIREKSIGKEDVDKIIAKIRDTDVMNKSCATPTIITGYSAIIYNINLDGKRKSIEFPGCEDDLKDIEKLIPIIE